MYMSYVSLESRVPDLVSRDDAYLKTVELHKLFTEINTSIAVHFMEQIRGNADKTKPDLVDLFAKTQITLAQIQKFLEIDSEINPRVNQMLNH